MNINYRTLLDGLRGIEKNTPDLLDYFSVTIKIGDEYFGIRNIFLHTDQENPTGAGVIDEGTIVLEIE